MKKIIALLMAVLLSLSLFACGSKNKEPETVTAQVSTTAEATTEATAEVTTEAETEEPTEKPTEAPAQPQTEEPEEPFDVKTALGNGYWISGGERSIYVYTYNGKEMWHDYYENQNGVYVKMEGPGYSNFCIPEIYEDSFVMYGTGGMKTTYYFTDNPRVVKSKADSNGHYDVWINYDYIPNVNTVATDMSKYK